jgi:hypothetical protein
MDGAGKRIERNAPETLTRRLPFAAFPGPALLFEMTTTRFRRLSCPGNRCCSALNYRLDPPNRARVFEENVEGRKLDDTTNTPLAPSRLAR